MHDPAGADRFDQILLALNFGLLTGDQEPDLVHTARVRRLLAPLSRQVRLEPFQVTADRLDVRFVLADALDRVVGFRLALRPGGRRCRLSGPDRLNSADRRHGIATAVLPVLPVRQPRQHLHPRNFGVAPTFLIPLRSLLHPHCRRELHQGHLE